MRTSFVVLMLLPFLFMCGCREGSQPLASDFEEDQSLLLSFEPVMESGEMAMPRPFYKRIKDGVFANCWLVQQAVEAFAERNNGVYPSNTNVDRNLDGKTVVDLLPGGTLLKNPYHGYHTEPIDCIAANPGETGFQNVCCRVNEVLVTKGYTITGTDRHCYTCVIIYRDCDGEISQKLVY